ncbi:hypothetical protein JB92DRAFT_2859800 [Gautieria morchelliformis]|nr:hypothetical protein JB92DRAFT_2859800 [Gautieria morchelliformis]
MSSKRGRKVNKDLPPSRARDVQRAFRARRAAHLEALEDRVSVLEQENSLLRAALKLPPSDRPLLGRGPTGKEKPKSIFGTETPEPQLVETIRRASVSTASTEASNVSQNRSPNSSTTAPYIQGDRSTQSFEFPQWDNALMIHEDNMVDSSDSSPPAEGHVPPPLKLSPVSFFNHHPLPLRHSDAGGVVSPESVHSRSNSYSQSSSASSAGPDTFSPVYMLAEMPEDSPNLNYSQDHRQPSQHLCPPEPFSHFQYPLSTPSSAGAAHQHSSPHYLNRRESDHVLNISYARQSPQLTRAGPIEPASSSGHRRAITEPQTLRALVTQYSPSPRGNVSAPLSAHSIRVPSPPPVPVMDRDGMVRKFSLA